MAGALYIEAIHEQEKHERLEVEIEVSNGIVVFKIDSGANVTVIGKEHLEKFGLKVYELKRTNKTLKGANNSKIKCYSYFSC